LAGICVVVLSLGTHIYGQERKAALRKKELEVEFDAMLRGEGKKITEKLEHRLRKKRTNREEPSLFDGEEK
jgi:hypothetical protein